MKKLNEILELIVFKHSIFALPFLLISMFAVYRLNDIPTSLALKLFVLAILCAVLARSFAMSINRYVDANIDAQNIRTRNRPSADGRISKAALLGFIILCAVLFVALTYFINFICFALSVPTLVLLGSYSYFKRFSEFAHVILGICLGFSCVAAELVLTSKVSALSLSLAFGVSFWTAGFDVLYALQDEEFDRSFGLFSIPARHGHLASVFISRIFHISAFVFFVLFGLIANVGLIAWIGILAVAGMLIAEQYLAALGRIEKAFFNTNAAISVVFLIFYLLDWIANEI